MTYYTPTVEEFHIGFECEKVTYNSDGGHQMDTFSGKWVFHTVNKFDPRLEPSWYRVKHLDREDIESFGFMMNDIFKDNTEKDLYYNNSVMTSRGEQSVGIYHVPQTMWCMIFFGNKNDIGDWSIEKMPNKVTVDFHTNTVFAGQLKNKSELKRVLTQIGVI